MKVIGAGFGRTGTASLRQALDELGFGPCYHMTEVMKTPRHKKLWLAAAQGDPVDWRELLAGYDSAVDWPACYFWRDLLAAYPDAKVVLTVRDPERWYDSTRETIYRLSHLTDPLLNAVIPAGRGMRALTDAVIWNGTFHGRFEDKTYALDVYGRHQREVAEHVPAGRLLIFDVGQGWGPLCRFLGVDPPEGRPFPHVNDSASMRATIRQVRIAKAALRALAVGVAATAVFWRAYRRSRSISPQHFRES